MINESQFLREVSIRICGSLEIDKALVSCFEYVSRVMPVDELIITIYDAEFKCLKNVAIADAFGAHLSSEEIPLTPLQPHEIQNTERFPRVRKLDNALHDPIIRRLAENRKWPPASVLVNRLVRRRARVIQESTGVYWKHGLPEHASRRALDPAAATRLWVLSEKMCGLDGGNRHDAA